MRPGRSVETSEERSTGAMVIAFEAAKREQDDACSNPKNIALAGCSAALELPGRGYRGVLLYVY